MKNESKRQMGNLLGGMLSGLVGTQMLKLLERKSQPFSVVVDRLKDASQVLSRDNPFYKDQIVTPRENFSYANAGQPHIVLKVQRLERYREKFGSSAYGKIADMEVAYIEEDGQIVSIWVESRAFEKWDDAKHGAKFDETAASAKKGHDELAEKIGDGDKDDANEIGEGGEVGESLLSTLLAGRKIKDGEGDLTPASESIN